MNVEPARKSILNLSAFVLLYGSLVRYFDEDLENVGKIIIRKKGNGQVEPFIAVLQQYSYDLGQRFIQFTGTNGSEYLY